MSDQLRMRIFAGPNGSGKSTIINDVRNHEVNGIPVDFGLYINADDIAKNLREGVFSFLDYEIETSLNEFVSIVLLSGLIGDRFNQKEFLESFEFDDNEIKLINTDFNEHLAQVLADFLR